METIIEASRRVSINLQDLYKQLKTDLNRVNKDISIFSKEFKEAAMQGDTSENAAYTDAKDKLDNLHVQKYRLLKYIEDIESLASDTKYVSRSFIGLYSTFRIKRLDTGKIETFRVYPGSMFDYEIGILPSESRIYSHLKDKQSGDVIEITNRITGEIVKYEVLEVY